MKKILVYPIGISKACQYASDFLVSCGICTVDHPTPEVTHLLLDIPSFGPDDLLRNGKDPEEYLQMLPPQVMVVGGNLMHPALAQRRTADFLRDAHYLAKNAAITADCAMQVAAPKLTTVWADTPTLIIGWGRIGKCLADRLQKLGCPVAVAARNNADRGMLQALGIQAMDISQIAGILPGTRLLFNTAPEPVLSEEVLSLCRNCVKIDLASQPGIAGDDVIQARGLPGLHAPESSGKLIADTFLRLCKEADI